MADDDNTALQDSEEGQDSLLSGSGGQQDISGSQPPPTPQTPPQGALPGGGVASTNDDDSQMPRSGTKMFLGQLLRTVLSGGLAGMSQATPIMSRGAGAANQQAQQAQQNQRAQEASQRANLAAMDAHQEAIYKMMQSKMTTAGIAQSLIYLDDGHTQMVLEPIEKQTEFDRKEGLMQDEHDVEGEGMQGFQSANSLANSLNSKLDKGSSDHYKVGITDATDLKHVKFNVYKVDMNGKTTRSVVTGAEDGKLQYEDMTGKYSDLDFLNTENLKNINKGEVTDAIKAGMKVLNDPMPDLQPEAARQIKMMQQLIGLHGKIDPGTAKMAQDRINLLNQNYDSMYKNTQDKDKQQHPKQFMPPVEKPQDMAVGIGKDGNQIAGTAEELKAAGVKNFTKAGAAEAEKITNARSLSGVFDDNDPDDPGLVQLADKLDKEGKLGPAVTRFQEWLNHGNTVANFNAGDPSVQRLFTKMGLAQTGLMQVHVGARGSAQLLEHFKDLADAKQMSPSAFKTALDTETRYIKRKAMLPGQSKATQPSKPNGKSNTSGFDPTLFPKAQ